jgi:hypothetical protein
MLRPPGCGRQPVSARGAPERNAARLGVVEFDDRQFAFGMDALMRGMESLRATPA